MGASMMSMTPPPGSATAECGFCFAINDIFLFVSLLILLHEQSINTQYLFLFDDLCCDILCQVKNKYSNKETLLYGNIFHLIRQSSSSLLLPIFWHS